MASVDAQNPLLGETSCSFLLQQLQEIWDEVGETDEDRDNMLLQIDQECLDVYKRKVDQAVKSRAHLLQALADAKIEFSRLLSALGEKTYDGIPEKASGSIKEQLAAIAPALEKLWEQKDDRVKEFLDVQSQIEKISIEIAGTSDQVESPKVDESDLSLIKLDQFHAQLQDLHNEKSERLHKVLEFVNTIHDLCAVLDIDFFSTITEVHPSLNDSTGVQSKSISNDTLSSLARTVLALEEDKKQRLQKSIAMDKRALYRAKLKEQKQKRIDSPLVRYNEHDQPVCRVCDVVLKSESQWPGHQASRKHHEAINNLKANAAAAKNPNNVKSEPPKELPKTKPEISESVSRKESEPSAAMSKPRATSMLPPNFFDQQETKRPKIEKDPARLGDHVSNRDPPVSDRTEEVEPSLARSSIQGLSTSKNAETRSTENQRSGENGPMSKVSSGSDAKQVKGALPAGFFDNKDADLRARGITPVKPDVKDEYKEFEKLIQEDLKEVDNRLEEEEIDAAEMIEEEVSVEQRDYKERLEMLRRKKMEVKAAKSSLGSKESKVVNKESSDDESSGDGDSDENLTVDWRAKHL